MIKTESANKFVYYATCDASWKCKDGCAGDSIKCEDSKSLEVNLEVFGWLVLENQEGCNPPEYTHICPAHKKALMEMLL